MQKKVKKNWVLRSMGLLLLFTLVSTCLLGSSLAKYTTTASSSDTARVAKWGVTINTAGGDLFNTQYNDPTDATVTVKSSTTDKLVAPGTKGVAGRFTITGTPEVACQVTVKVDSSSALTGWVDSRGAAYEPIVWSVNGTEVGSFADLITALNGITISYDPGEDVSASDSDYVISWEWPYTGNDENDTFLGNLATAPTINLDYSITVDQID